MKTYKILLFILIVTPDFIFSQQMDSNKIHPWSLGITFSPDFTYRNIYANKSYVGQVIGDFRDTTEIPRFGYTTGINLKRKMNNKISIKIGLLFADKGEQTIKRHLTFATPDPSNVTDVQFKYHYYFIDMPISIEYYLLNKKTKIFLTTGISFNYFIFYNQYSTLTYIDGHTSSKSQSQFGGYSFVNISFLGGIGFSYQISKKISIELIPTYRRSITSIVNAPITGILYSAGINFGIYYRL